MEHYYYSCDKCGGGATAHPEEAPWVIIQFRGSYAHLCKDCAVKLNHWLSVKD